METSIARFEPQNIRNEVVKQMEAMQNNKFVKLPENYKESAFFAIEKLANLPDIEKVPAVGITKALISLFSNNLDFRKNHCYFFVQNDKTTGKSLRFGWQYQGLISVAKSQPFGTRTFQMLFITFGVAAISFAIGWFVKHYLGIEI